jgi:hypothetical protein
MGQHLLELSMNFKNSETFCIGITSVETSGTCKFRSVNMAYYLPFGIRDAGVRSMKCEFRCKPSKCDYGHFVGLHRKPPIVSVYVPADLNPNFTARWNHCGDYFSSMHEFKVRVREILSCFLIPI